jgi:type IV pilus assembly protein PilM
MPFTGKSAVGLDIADRSIEVVELIDSKPNPQIVSMGRLLLSPGIVERGTIKDEANLLKSLQVVFAQSQPKPISTRQIVFGLPESQVYTHIFQAPVRQDTARDQLVTNEARTSIPLKAEDLMISYSVLSQTEDQVEILLIGISKQIFQAWKDLFQKIGLNIIFDIETLATYRGLFVDKPQSPVAIVDIGALSSNIAIFGSAGLRYSYTLGEAGETISQQLIDQLKMSADEVEKVKIEIGLTDPKHQAYSIITSQLNSIIDSIRASLEYYQEKTGHPVKKLVLVGGTSKMKGLIDYFKKNLTVSVWVGESNLLKNKASLEYIEAIGLALRGLNRPQDKNDPIIEIKLPANVASAVTSQNSGVVTSVSTIVPGSITAPNFNAILNTNPLDAAQIKKLKSEKLILIIVLIVALAGLGAAFWYRDYQRGQRQEEIEARLEKISQLPDKSEGPSDSQPAATAGPPSPTSESVASATPAEVKEETEESSADEAESTGSQVEILDTTTGWLNVRSGPGVDNDIVSRVNPGETYPLIDESGDWFEIKVDDQTTGWVSSEFVEVRQP